MPGFDGTGPLGLGPRTGGGRGLCPPVGPLPYAGFYPYAGYSSWGLRGYPYGSPPYTFWPWYGVGRGGFPRGCGRGRAFGGGRFHWWW